MPDVNVNVDWLQQETSYYCGPAVAQMMLTALGAAPPKLPPTWQDQLWEVVKNKTAATRPAGAPTSVSPPGFPKQLCEICSGQWGCWSTTPQVLEYLLGAYQTVADYSVSSPAQQKAATALILDTLDRQLPALALVRGWQHWLVVEGYRFNEAGSALVGGRNFNGVYVRDPWALESVHYIKRQKWFSEYMDFVPCGIFHGTFVVLGGVKTAVVAPQQAPPVIPKPRKKARR